MKIYNEDKTQELVDPDLGLGKLVNDQIQTGETPEVMAVEEVAEWITVKEYPNGGKDVEKVVTTPAVEYQPSQPIYEDILVYILYTSEELAVKQRTDDIQQVKQLKEQLASTDYKVLKYVEGKYVGKDDEWQFIVQMREGMREQIRELESAINSQVEDMTPTLP